MPTYEYRCKTCEEQFEVVQSFSDDALTVCPLAGEPASPPGCVKPGEGEVRKVFSAPGITFKGEGFYKTDSRSKSTKTATKTASSSSDSGSSDSSSSSSSDSSSSDSSSSDSKSTDSKSSGGSDSSTSSTKSDSKK